MTKEKDDDDEWESIKENEAEENNNEFPDNKRTTKKSYRYRRNNSYSKKDFRRRIRVENLNLDVTNKILQNLFSRYGKLTRCGIHFDKVGNSLGIADVEYSSHDECERAIFILDHGEINGKEMRVKYADNGNNFYRNTFGNNRGNVRRRNYLGQQRRNYRDYKRNNGNFERKRRSRRNDRNGIRRLGRYSRLNRNVKSNRIRIRNNRIRQDNNRKRMVFKNSLGRRNRK